MTASRHAGEGLAAWLLRVWHVRAAALGRVGAGANTRELAVLETLSLGARRQLLRVRCGEAEFLVGLGAESVNVIERLPPANEAAQ